MNKFKIHSCIIFVFVIFFASTNETLAYIGLGPLIPIIGNALIFIFISLVAFLGLFFYPFKKLSEKLKSKKKKKMDESENKN